VSSSRNQAAVLIKAEQDDPVVNRIRPFTIRQKAFWLCSKRPKQSRDASMTPRNENHFSLVICTPVSGQLGRLFVTKTRIHFQFGCIRERLDRQTRLMALL